MTNKDNLQKELKEKIKAGIKPSHLRKSKSLDNIPSASSLSNTPLQKSKSQLEIPPQQSELVQLQETVKFHAQTAQNYLQSLQSAQVKITELEEELKKSQESPTELKNKISQLEQQILELRLDKVKEFGDYYEKKQDLEKELDENITEGVQEIRRLENKLLATNKKKFELAQKLSQAQGKNADLELQMINNSEPSTFNYWPIITTIALVSLSLWLFNQKQE